MTVDCQWVEKNLEALFCDRLTENENNLLRIHIGTCDSCRKEAQALQAIDPLIKNHFRRELRMAVQPRRVRKSRVFGLGTAVTAIAALSFVLLVRSPQATQPVEPVPVQTIDSPAAKAVPPAAVKTDESGDLMRAKPSAEASPGADRRVETPVAITSKAPDFLVTDPAGYTHTLDEFRGRVVVVAVWRLQDLESIAAIEHLYKTYAANPKLRFVGVSNQRQAKPVNTTFPVVYNQGSKLFGARAGEFVLIDENGNVELRGSLVRDIESIRRALQEK